MWHDILFFLMGLVLIIVGGNGMTDGASAIARRFHISELVIGLTVVAFGSSLPDLVVCVQSTIQGHPELAIGDVVGANIFDILLVVGIVAILKPIHITADMEWNDMPMLALSGLILFFCGEDILIDGVSMNTIDRTDGLMLLTFFIIFMVNTARNAKAKALKPAPAGLSQTGQTGRTSRTSETQPKVAAKDAGFSKFLRFFMSPLNIWASIIYIIAGAAALIIGGNWIVSGASGIARHAGLSEGLIGLTVVGIGSSIPDLSTSVIAAMKNKPGLALGNVVGACIFNVFFILGVCGIIHPLLPGTIGVLDFATLAGGGFLVWLFGVIWGWRVINRYEGIILVLCYLAYFTKLIIDFFQ